MWLMALGPPPHVTHHDGQQAQHTLKLELEWTQGFGAEPKGGRWDTNLADHVHLPVTDLSLAEPPGDIKWSVP